MQARSMGQEDPEHTWFQLELLVAETSCRRQTKHMGKADIFSMKLARLSYWFALQH